MTRKYSFWSDEEKRKLVELYPHYSLIELEVIFKRSIRSISRMANSLGVRKYECTGELDNDYDVCLKLVTIHYKVRAKRRTEAKHKAISLLTNSLHNRKNITDLICLSQSTVNKVPKHDNH